MIKKNKADKEIYKKTVMSFLLAFLICAFASIIVIQDKINVERLKIERLILESSFAINDVISKQLYKTKLLEALVIEGNGTVEDFHEMAHIIMANEPAIANLLLAPNGIVSDVYPLEENIAVIGFDFFNTNSPGNREAILARNSKNLVMGGPFITRQGFLALVGRYPVYIIDTETEKNRFWGLVSVTLKFPEALDAARFSALERYGFLYELWRINPDTNQKQVIATNNTNLYTNASYMEKAVSILNAEWYFRIFPVRLWYEYQETWLLLAAGTIISFLIASVVKKNSELKIIKYNLQNLTGTLNKIAVKFLAKSNRTFNDLMTDEVCSLADTISIDRLSVWRNSIKSDGLYTSRIYHWEKAVGGTAEMPENLVDVAYSEFAPNWEKIFAANSAVNSPVCMMPMHEAANMKAPEAVSVFAAPVFINDSFWGFVLFEDHKSERYFEDNHAEFMHSAAFLFVNAVIRNETEREIMETNELNNILYNNAPIGITIFDENPNFINCNNQICNMLGTSEPNLDDYINKFSPEYQADGMKSVDKAYEINKRVLQGEQQVFEWIHKSVTGELIPCEVTITRARHNGKTIGLSYIYDLRHVKSMEKKIIRLESEVEKIYVDALTGICNRRYFDENFKRIVKSFSRFGGALTLMIVDIDFFKRYNDTYGHMEGDKCLKAVAETLSKSLTRIEDFTARYGGEEFAVVLPHTDEDGARLVAEKLLENIRNLKITHERNDAADCVTISIGIITSAVSHTQKSDDYIIQADKMLYESKNSGRNKYTAGRF